MTPTGFGKLTLTWSPPTEPGTCGAVDGYQYQLKVGEDGSYSTWTDIDNSANLTSYEFTGYSAGKVHFFKLRATVGTSNGTESAEESGTTWAAIEVRLDVPSSVREDAGSLTFAVVAESEELSRRRFEARLGYGLAVFSGRFTATPELGLGLSNGQREMSLGWRLGLARSGPASLELRLDGTRRESANDNDPEHGVTLRLNARW